MQLVGSITAYNPGCNRPYGSISYTELFFSYGKHTMKKIALFVAALSPSMVWAHAGHEHLTFASGALHLFTGLDHLLALIASGLCLGMLGQRRQQASNLLLIGAVLLAAVLVAPMLPVFNMEPAIIATLIVLGSLLALALAMPAYYRIILLAGVAGVHGITHGQEMATQSIAYAAALSLTSVAVMGVSLSVAIVLQRLQWHRLIRAAGLSIAAGGLLLLSA